MGFELAEQFDDLAVFVTKSVKAGVSRYELAYGSFIFG